MTRLKEHANLEMRTVPEVARPGGMRVLVFLFGTRRHSEIYYGNGCPTQSIPKGATVNGQINEMSVMIKFFCFFNLRAGKILAQHIYRLAVKPYNWV